MPRRKPDAAKTDTNRPESTPETRSAQIQPAGKASAPGLPEVTLTRLYAGTPIPEDLGGGLIRVKLAVGDHERCLPQNNRRPFYTRLGVQIPSDHALRVHPGPELADPLDAKRFDTMLAIDPASQFITESSGELIIGLRNMGMGAYWPKDWELSVILQLVPLHSCSLTIEATDDCIAAETRQAQAREAETRAA